MNASAWLAALAIVASTVTAAIGMFVTYRTQRTAVREQQLWDARTETYLLLQEWLEDLQAWRESSTHEPPPVLPSNLLARTALYGTSDVHRALAYLKVELRQAAHLVEAGEWRALAQSQSRMTQELGVALTRLMRDELRGTAKGFELEREPSGDAPRRNLPTA